MYLKNRIFLVFIRSFYLKQIWNRQRFLGNRPRDKILWTIFCGRSFCERLQKKRRTIEIACDCNRPPWN